MTIMERQKAIEDTVRPMSITYTPKMGQELREWANNPNTVTVMLSPQRTNALLDHIDRLTTERDQLAEERRISIQTMRSMVAEIDLHKRERDELAALVERLKSVAQEHHDWAMSYGDTTVQDDDDDEPITYNLGDSYAESGMYDRTTAALALTPDDALEAHDEALSQGWREQSEADKQQITRLIAEVAQLRADRDRARLDLLDQWLAARREVRFLRSDEDGCWIYGNPSDVDTDQHFATVREVIDYDAK